MNSNNSPINTRKTKKRGRVNSNSNSNTESKPKTKKVTTEPLQSPRGMLNTNTKPATPIVQPFTPMPAMAKPLPMPATAQPLPPVPAMAQPFTPVPATAQPFPPMPPMAQPFTPVPAMATPVVSVPAMTMPVSVSRPTQSAIDLTKKVDWSWDYRMQRFNKLEIELFCRKVHAKLSRDPFPLFFPDTTLKVELTMLFISKFNPFKAPNGQTLDRQHVQGEEQYDEVKKRFEYLDGRKWNETAISEGLITSIGSGPGRVCINRPGGLVLTSKLSSDVLAHICQLAGAIPFEIFLEILLIQRKSKFLWCFAKTTLKKVGVGIFSASTLNPNNIRDDPQTRTAERYWEAQLSYYISLCMIERSGLKFFMPDNMETIEHVLKESAALAAAGNATFRCLRQFSLIELSKTEKKDIIRSLAQKLHGKKDSEALSSMFVKDASIENVRLLSDSFFYARSSRQYGTLMESLGYSIMDTLYKISQTKGKASDQYLKFFFRLTSIPNAQQIDIIIKMRDIIIKIGNGTREQLPIILMTEIGRDTRMLYAMFEMAVYAGCDKILFFIRNIKPQIGEMITSLAIAVNDTSHPVSAYLLGTSGSNSEVEDSVRSRGRSPIRNASGPSGISFRPVEGRGRSRVSRVFECDIRNQKTALFVKNMLLALQEGTYRQAGTNAEVYNFFANICAVPWETRFNLEKYVYVKTLSYNMFLIFGDDDNGLKTSNSLSLSIISKMLDKEVQMDTVLTKAEYEGIRSKLGPDPKTMVDAYYVPYTKLEFEGEFSKGDFAKTLNQIGQKLKLDVKELLYPTVSGVEDVFENALAE